MNPILVDPRTGSKELFSVLSTNGVQIQMAREEMLAGDFCFEGQGPGGSNVLIGVERKTVRDMLASIRSGRFSGHQLVIMTQMYYRYYLIVEGIYGCGLDGLLEEPKFSGGWGPLEVGGQRFMHSMLDRFLISLEEGSGIRVHRTSNMRDTGRRVINMWHTWNDKEYEKHRACSARVVTHVEIKPWSLKRRFARDCPGIGDELSLACDKHFPTAHALINAEVEELTQIPGIGKGKAQKMYAAIREVPAGWVPPDVA